MAQHDYVIDNQSAPSARADINSALSAIVTQNSGASAPATTYADMFWYDTTNNQLKKRNEANSAWIVLGTIDESTNKFTPNSALTTAGIDPATLVVAAEGIASNNNDTTLPTSAAVKAYTDTAIAAIPSTAQTVLLGTLTTTSGISQSLTGLNLNPYSMLLIEVIGVSCGNTSAYLTLGSGQFSGTLGNSANSWVGTAFCNLTGGYINGLLREVNSNPQIFSAATGYSKATTTLTISCVGSSFDAGSIRVYGVQ
jgi:hypothetical protein